jgi:hypothetical protein
MARAAVYIDGFNLYYGALKGTPYKWFMSWQAHHPFPQVRGG